MKCYDCAHPVHPWDGEGCLECGCPDQSGLSTVFQRELRVRPNKIGTHYDEED